jgi:type II secretory pathway pseudopilin PulG
LTTTFSQKTVKRPDLSGNQGFALLATLLAVALIGIAAAFFASRVDVLRDSAIQTQTWALAEREAFSTRQALVYTASTTPRALRGIEIPEMPNASLVADGRVYALSESLNLSVQDERGLLPLTNMEDRETIRFFSAMGIPASQHAKLLDALRDYIDPDNLRHLNGAEANEYAAKGRAPPANDFLRTRDELPTVLNWDDLFAAIEKSGGSERREQFLALFTAARHAGVNLNTAPADVLLSVEGIDPKRISALIDQRKLRPFSSYADLTPFLNGRLNDEHALLVGTNTWRVTHYKAGMPFLLECQIALTAAALDQPAKISACRRRPLALRENIPPGEMTRVISRAFGVSGGSAPDSRRSGEIVGRPLTTFSALPQSSFNRERNRTTTTIDPDAKSPQWPLPWLTSALGPQSSAAVRP